MKSRLIVLVILLLFLGVAAVFDVRYRRIPLWLPGIALMSELSILLFFSDLTIGTVLAGCIPGAAILLLSLLTKQAIGLGDGISFLVAGIVLGFLSTTLLLLASLFLAAIASLLMIVLRHRKKNAELPFLPFVLAGYIVLLVL